MMRRSIIFSLSLVLIAVCLQAIPQNPSTDNNSQHFYHSFVGDFNPRPSQPMSVNAETPVSERANEDSCECVPYYLCKNGTISNDGTTIIDIRITECNNIFEVCCKPPEMLNSTVNLISQQRIRRGCGHRNVGGVGFQITGNVDGEAEFGEFPWMVAILRKSETKINDKRVNYNYHCGGALIHYKAVLTAAHYAKGKLASQLSVRAGEWDTQTEFEPLQHQNRDVESIIVHEDFHSGALYNDVAILILKTPVDPASHIDLVCLPPPNEIFDEARCFATGWGKDNFSKEGPYQAILKKIELPIVSHAVCQNSLRQTRLGRYYNLHPSFVCAGGEAGKDTCKGDGGSPLVCPLKNDPSRYAQVGIVAWGIGCGENQIPGIYANVAYLRSWIDRKMTVNNLDTASYQA